MLSHSDYLQFGFVTLNNTSKFNDILFVAITISLGAAFGLFLKLNTPALLSPEIYVLTKKSNRYVSGFKKLLEKYSFVLSNAPEVLAVGFVSFTIFSLLELAVGTRSIIPSLSALMVTLCVSFSWRWNESSKVNGALKLCVLSSIAVNCVLTTVSPAPTLFALFFATLLILCRSAASITLFAYLVFFTGMPPGITEMVFDGFHSAEFFISTQNFHQRSYFDIFPNIGYLEELTRKGVRLLFDSISMQKFSPSYLSSFLVTKILLLFMLSLFYGSLNNILFAFFIISLAMFDMRISALFVVCLLSLLCSRDFGVDHFTVKIVAAFVNKIRRSLIFIIWASLPIICLTLNPHLALTLSVFAFACLQFSDQSPRTKCLTVMLVLPATLAFAEEIRIYFETYMALGSSISEAGALPMNFFNLELLLARFLITGSIFSGLILLLLDRHKQRNTGQKISVIFCFLSVVYICFTYASSRVDDSLSRFYSTFALIGPCLVFLSNMAGSRKAHEFMCISIILIQLIIHGTNFIKPPRLELGLPTEWRQPPLHYSDELVKKITFLNQISLHKRILFFSTFDVAIQPKVTNSIITKFTSPYVSIGKEAQMAVYNQIVSDPNQIVYLGTTLKTFDGLDVRVRASLIFKLLAQDGYEVIKLTPVSENVLSHENYYFIVRKNSLPFEFNGKVEVVDIFGGFNVGKSIIYHQNKELDYDNVSILYECFSADAISENAKIVNTGNSYYADLHCGLNRIPNILQLGEFVRATSVRATN